MADLLNTTAEFTYSYTDNFTGSLQYDFVLAAFGSSSANIVSLSITAAALGAVTADAAFYSHVTDTQTAAQAYATTFDVGYSTTAAASSTYTKSSTSLTSGAGGPAATSEGYGTLELGGVFLTATGDSVTFKGMDNTLVLDSPGAATTLPLAGFNQAGDQVVLNGVVDLNATILGYSNGILSFRNNGTTYSLNIAGGTSASNFTLASGAVVEGGNASTYATDLVIDYVPCFLRGTMIATPTGEVAVEALRRGDLVTALEGDGPVARPVTWVGSSLMRVGEAGRSRRRPARPHRPARLRHERAAPGPAGDAGALHPHRGRPGAGAHAGQRRLGADRPQPRRIRVLPCRARAARHPAVRGTEHGELPGWRQPRDVPPQRRARGAWRPKARSRPRWRWRGMRWSRSGPGSPNAR